MLYIRYWPPTRAFGEKIADIGETIAGVIEKDFSQIEVRLSYERADLPPTVYGPDGRKYEGKFAANRLTYLQNDASVRSYFKGWAVSYNFIENRQDGPLRG